MLDAQIHTYGLIDIRDIDIYIHYGILYFLFHLYSFLKCFELNQDKMNFVFENPMT